MRLPLLVTLYPYVVIISPLVLKNGFDSRSSLSKVHCVSITTVPLQVEDGIEGVAVGVTVGLCLRVGETVGEVG